MVTTNSEEVMRLFCSAFNKAEELIAARQSEEASMVALVEGLFWRMVEVIKPVIKYVDQRIVLQEVGSQQESRVVRGIRIVSTSTRLVLTRDGTLVWDWGVPVDPEKFRCSLESSFGVARWGTGADQFEVVDRWFAMIQELVSTLDSALKKLEERSVQLRERRAAIAVALGHLGVAR